MSGFHFAPGSRRVRLLLKIVMFGAAALAFGACSSGAPVQAQDGNAAIGIQTSQLSIEVVNRVGMPLTDVNVSIVPVGGATQFKKFVGRMENAEKKDLALGGFFGNVQSARRQAAPRPRDRQGPQRQGVQGRVRLALSAWQAPLRPVISPDGSVHPVLLCPSGRRELCRRRHGDGICRGRRQQRARHRHPR
jgi:hypothetical protein